MADYSLDMFESGGLFVDFIEQGKLCDRLSDVLEGKVGHVTTKAGPISNSLWKEEAHCANTATV
jgi:hypothetical protein